MSPDKEQRLYDAFPTLYGRYSPDFECGDGWFQLLWDFDEFECVMRQTKE